MTYVAAGTNDDLVILCDSRTQYDYRLGTGVLTKWGFGTAALGRSTWNRTTRIAAFDYGKKTTAAGRERKRQEIRKILSDISPRVCVVLASQRDESKQKVDQLDEAPTDVKGSFCWQALDPPASLESMAGTFWKRGETYVVALQNPANCEHAINWQIAEHLRRASRVAWGTEHLLDLDDASECLPNIRETSPLAVDIETIPHSRTITMIGVSDGKNTVAIPWDAYKIKDTGETTAGVSSAQHDWVRKILATDRPKIFHNYVYDVPFLQSRDIEVRGPIHDTMLLHGLVYKQLRHGLQVCVALEYAVEPWKTLFAAGKNRDPDPSVWAMGEQRLRRYNLRDTAFTWHLGKTLSRKAGVTIGDFA